MKRDSGAGAAKDIGEVAGEVAAKTEPCPICKKPSLAAYEPFCSKRCADVETALVLRRIRDSGNGRR